MIPKAKNENGYGEQKTSAIPKKEKISQSMKWHKKYY